MLEGKPAREDEVVTIESIKNILADYEAEFVAAESKPRNPKLRERHEDHEFLGNLQPVATVETKVARPKFTTVPNSDQQHASVRPVANKISKSASRAGAAKVNAKAPSASDVPARNDVADAPSQHWSLPKLPAMPQLPKLTLPQFKLPQKATPRSQETPVAKTPVTPEPMQMLRKATEQTEVSPLELAIAKARRFLTPKRTALLVLALFALLRPGIFIFLLLLSVFVIGCTVLLVGPERIWDIVAKLAKWYTDRYPDKKDAVYQWLDDAAVRWDGWLDRLPAGSVDSLYMPDFSNIDEIERQHDAIVTDRLNRMQSQG